MVQPISRRDNSGVNNSSTSNIIYFEIWLIDFTITDKGMSLCHFLFVTQPNPMVNEIAYQYFIDIGNGPWSEINEETPNKFVTIS